MTGPGDRFNPRAEFFQLTKEDWVCGKHLKIRMVFLDEHSVADQYIYIYTLSRVNKSSTNMHLHKESEAHRQYIQCYWQTRARLSSTSLHPGAEIRILLLVRSLFLIFTCGNCCPSYYQNFANSLSNYNLSLKMLLVMSLYICGVGNLEIIAAVGMDTPRFMMTIQKVMTFG